MPQDTPTPTEPIEITLRQRADVLNKKWEQRRQERETLRRGLQRIEAQMMILACDLGSILEEARDNSPAAYLRNEEWDRLIAMLFNRVDNWQQVVEGFHPTLERKLDEVIRALTAR